jgi:Zn-dependent protease
MFISQLFDRPVYFLSMVLVIVLSVCLHELGHGVAAIWLGDRTPIERGHMSLNPIVHMGVPSLILLLVAGIAWGAMPVDPRRMRGRFAPAIVAAAGPVVNVILAAIGIGTVGLWQRADPGSGQIVGTFDFTIQYLLGILGYANILLALFNLLPIPPLDGSKILGNLSRGYANLVDSLYSSSGYSMQITLLAFIVAGFVISPMAQHIFSSVLISIRGFR